VNFSVVRAISGLNAEKTLYECKKKQLQQAKCQSGTRRMIQKDEVLKESEDAQQIADRTRKEVEQDNIQLSLRVGVRSLERH
jgi:hypothetical protein